VLGQNYTYFINPDIWRFEFNWPPFITTPQNQVVRTSTSRVIFYCTPRNTTATVNWLFYDANNVRSPCYVYKHVPIILYSARARLLGSYPYCNDTSRFRLISRTYHLNISRPRTSDAGTYVCVESGGQKAAAILGIIGRPMCHIIIIYYYHRF